MPEGGCAAQAEQRHWLRLLALPRALWGGFSWVERALSLMAQGSVLVEEKAARCSRSGVGSFF